MKPTVVTVAIFFLLLCSAGSALGDTLGCGARAIALGGAYVAAADDGAAPYWNPAGITRINVLTFTPSLGMVGSWNYSGSILDINNFPPHFNESSMALDSQGYLGISSRYFAINVLYEVNGNYGPVSSSKAEAMGLGVGYGVLTLAATPTERLAMGINLKTVYGKVVLSDMDSSLPTPSASLSTAQGQGTAFDLGLIYTVNDQVDIGLVGRNLLASFNWNNGTITNYHYDPTTNTIGATMGSGTYNPTIELTRSYTLGTAYRPFSSTLVGADMELIDANGVREGETRLHLGIEQRVLGDSLAVRLGGFTIKNQGPALSGGVGYKLGPVSLDLTAVQDNGNWGFYCNAGFTF